jgi:hypothetical protein
MKTEDRKNVLNFKNTEVFLKRPYEDKDLTIFLVFDQMSKIIGAM